MGKKILKICLNEWHNASHDKRELSVYRELGDDILVICKNPDQSGTIRKSIDGYDAICLNTRPLGKKVSKLINRAIAYIQWTNYIRELDCEVISGHDLFATVMGCLYNIGKRNKSKLIYDSHEFELGRNKKRSKLQYHVVKKLEGFLMRRCAFSIMVNDVIADEVQRIHNLEERPVVVRNIPNYWTIDEGVCKATRQELLALMTKPKEMMLMYHGGVMNNRGIETLLKVVADNPNVCAVILGNGDEAYVNTLKVQAYGLGITSRVLFHDAVAIEELWKYVGAADIGTILAPTKVKSYVYSLPNKFFENIQSETPVICPSYPAMKPIVDKYEIGLTCDPENIGEINRCIEKFRNDKAFYQHCKEKLKEAKKELCWENEKKVLIEAYRKYL